MISYTLYLKEPSSRNLDGRVAEEKRRSDLHRITYLVASLTEDLEDLLPAGWEVKISDPEEHQ